MTSLLDQIKADREAVTTQHSQVRAVVGDWERAGCADDCFWEWWAECPTTQPLTPSMVGAVLDENTKLRTALLAAGELSDAVVFWETAEEVDVSDAIYKLKTALAAFRKAIEVK